jgi:hypothetical protein
VPFISDLYCSLAILMIKFEKCLIFNKPKQIIESQRAIPCMSSHNGTTVPTKLKRRHLYPEWNSASRDKMPYEIDASEVNTASVGCSCMDLFVCYRSKACHFLLKAPHQNIFAGILALQFKAQKHVSEWWIGHVAHSKTQP